MEDPPPSILFNFTFQEFLTHCGLKEGNCPTFLMSIKFMRGHINSEW